MSVGSEGRVIGGRYRLERVLGAGGMGEVWLARHLELDSPVALKLMAPGLIRDATARARFRREARAAANLRSPHLVAVHDFGEDEGTPYLVMEWLQGETLSQAVAGAKITPARAVELVDQACAGLGFAHAQGIIHRDIKPSNLFLAEIAGEPVLKIVDFGIARALVDDEDANVTRSGAILGSPAFMSPAQANGEPATVANDLWSMAAVAYWMLVGREPFSGSMMSATLHRIRTGQFTPPSQLAPALSPAVDAFFAKAFSLEPERRFQSAEELALALRLALHEVDGERPPAIRSSRFRLVALVAAGATALVVLASLSRSATQRTTVPVEPSAASQSVFATSLEQGAEIGSASPSVALPPLPPQSSSTAIRISGSTPSSRAPIVAPTHPSSTLTQAPPPVTRPAGESVDPLFGIVVKSPRNGGAGGAGDLGIDAGLVGKSRAARSTP